MGRFECTWPNEAIIIRYPRRTLADDPDFLFESELVQVSGVVNTFVHIGVSRFTPAVLRRMKHLWPSIRRQLPPIVFAQGDTTDDLWCKFVGHFGFRPVLDDCPCSDGADRRIFAHFRIN